MMDYLKDVPNDGKIIQEVEDVTPKKYFKMRPVDRLSFHINLAYLESFGLIKDFGEFVENLRHKEITYKYEIKYGDNKRKLVREPKEVCEIYGYKNINKFWYEYRNGNISETVTRVNVRVYFDNEGNKLAEKEFAVI